MPATIPSTSISRRGRSRRVLRRDREAVAAPDHVGDRGMGQHLDAVLPVVVVEERRQVRRKEAAADAGLGQDHHDLLAVHGQGCRDLRADEPAADHGEALPACCLLTQALVVLERAVVGDPVAADWEASRRHAGREQQFVEAVLGSPVVDDALVLEIEQAAGAAEMEVNAKLVRAEPDAVQRFALPELLGEGRALVGRVRFGADQADRAVRHRPRGCRGQRHQQPYRRRR